MAIHEVDSGNGRVSFVISSKGCWRPGSYASQAAAFMAFQCCDHVLADLRDRINRAQGRDITKSDLRALASLRCASCGPAANDEDAMRRLREADEDRCRELAPKSGTRCGRGVGHPGDHCAILRGESREWWPSDSTRRLRGRG